MFKRKASDVDPYDVVAIEQAAVFLLGRREHSSVELVRKLKQKGYAEEAIDRVLAQLQERGWQSDQRYAEILVRQRLEAAYGPLKIYQDAQLKGLDKTLIEQLLQEREVNWQALAVERYQRRFGTQPPGDEKELARRQRHLAGRGFYPQDVYAACKVAVAVADETPSPSGNGK